MRQAFRSAPFLVVLLLAGCATTPGDTGRFGPPEGPVRTPLGGVPTQFDIASYVDPAALRLLSATEKTVAATAQFHALQTGRAGAPRTWSGESGTTGSIIVGPPVTVNALYCRTFSHTVSTGNEELTKQGMTCRNAEGQWEVEG